MNQISDAVLETFAVLAVVGIVSVMAGSCLLVRFLVTGRALFERQQPDQERNSHGLIHRLGDR